jgi:hypothetical protein
MRPMCYCKEIGHWKNECPCCKGTASEPNKITPVKKTGCQPKPEAQDLTGLAGIKVRLGETRLLTTTLLNDLHGGLRHWAFCGH